MDEDTLGAERGASVPGAKEGDGMERTRDIKASLRRLVGPDPETTIELAADATGDLEAAARFVESVGLDRLTAAIEATTDGACETRGRRALESFRRFQRAAAGEFDPESDRSGGSHEPDGDHVHPGRGTHLRHDGERPFR